jgi:hypothetical protein
MGAAWRGLPLIWAGSLFATNISTGTVVRKLQGRNRGEGGVGVRHGQPHRYHGALSRHSSAVG